MDRIRILLADDDRTFCELTGSLLTRAGYHVYTAQNIEQARALLTHGDYDILMLDLCFPALSDGFEMLEEVRDKLPQLLILMISGSGSNDDVVRAIKNGAHDFITKPVNPESLLVRIQNLGDRILKQRQIKALEHSAIAMVGVSESLRKVLDHISAAAKTDLPVLITGETGVGKELAARAIHKLSAWSGRDMVSINCASVPKELFEAELFGYAKGAFTGAVASFKGYFEFAQNSSFFLDEISELPLDVQAKLLRVLSEGEVQRLGGKVDTVRTRVISASNAELPALVKTGHFRQDLYYRLDSLHIHIPPLRQRPEDISPLASHFLSDFCRRKQLPPKEISPRAEVWLAEQAWRGNARELKNCVERAVVLAQRDALVPEDFLAVGAEPDPSGLEPGTLRDSLKRYEEHLICQHLKANHYNVTQTARQLGIDRSNLWKRIHALGIDLVAEPGN